MKTLLTLLLLIPSLSWGLTFKDGKQVEDTSSDIKEEETIKKNICNEDQYLIDEGLLAKTYIFDFDALQKTTHNFPTYKKHTPPDEPPVKSVTYIATKIHAVGDIDNDGIDDLVLIFMETNVAPIILYGKKSKNFDVLELQKLSKNFARKNYRKIVLNDINNDGLLDIIGFTTAEHHPGFDMGEPNIIIKNLGNRKFEEIDLPIFRKYDSNHGGFVIDLDNDGYSDIVALSDPAAPGKMSYPIKNINGNKFELVKKDINREISNSWTHDGDGGDVNQDGFNDLVIASVKSENLSEQNNFKTLRIILGDGDLNFHNNQVIKLGKNWVTKDEEKAFVEEYNYPLKTGSSNIQLIDINNDGLLDILEGYYVLYNGTWASSGFNSYINKGNDCFLNETIRYFPNQSLNRSFKNSLFTGFISGFHHSDVNNDGFNDLVLRSWGNVYPHIFNQQIIPYVFMNIENKYYLPLDSSKSKNLKNMSSYIAGDFNGDGLMDIGGLNDPGLYSLNIFWGGSETLKNSELNINNEDLLQDLELAIQ